MKGIQPGHYVREKGTGELVIMTEKRGVLSFSIESVGANCHTCSISGEILDGKAVVAERGSDEKPCVVVFTSMTGGIDVSAIHEECRSYCGMRADFQGPYLNPVPGCSSAEVRKVQNEFKRLFDRKAYNAAGAKLEPILTQCSATLNWLEIGWIRNDLALTQYKLHNFGGCRQTLQPLAGDAAKTDDALKEEYPPCDADNYLPIIKAARTNLKLCNRGGKKAP